MKKPIFSLFLAPIIFSACSIESTVEGAREYDDFAQCINDSGAQMYGAFWCAHCEGQLEMFGYNAENVNEGPVPYIECSNPDRSQTPTCIEQNVQSYPTWVFGDGTRTTGRQSFSDLSAATGCAL